MAKEHIERRDTYKGSSVSYAADAITDVLNGEELSKEVRKKLMFALDNLTSEDIICIPWNTDDVLGIAKKQGVKMTRKKTRGILHYMYYKHDNEQGINWDTITYHVLDIN